MLLPCQAHPSEHTADCPSDYLNTGSGPVLEYYLMMVIGPRLGFENATREGGSASITRGVCYLHLSLSLSLPTEYTDTYHLHLYSGMCIMPIIRTAYFI